MNRKNISKKHYLIITGAFVLIILFFLALPWIVKHELNKKIEQFNANSGYLLKTDDLQLSGYSQVTARGIVVENNDSIEIVHVSNLSVSLSLFSYLLGGDVIDDMRISGAKINIDDILNKFKKTKSQSADTTKEERNSEKTLKRLLKFLPANFYADSIDLSYTRNKIKYGLFVDSLFKETDDIKAQFSMYSDTNRVSAIIEGNYGDDEIGMVLKPLNNKILEIPYSSFYNNSYLAVDSVIFSGTFKSSSNIRFIQNIAVYNMNVSNEKLSTKEFTLPYIAGKIDFSFSNTQIEIHKDSYIQVDEFKLFPILIYEYKKPQKINFSFTTGTCVAQSIVKSLPPDIFTNIAGLELDGAVSISLNTSIDFAHLDDLVFDIKVETDKLKIKKFGQSNLAMMSGDFIHRIYENDVFTKQIHVSALNPRFVKLDSISKYLKSSILVAEDGLFYSHKGFIGDAFRYALIQNLKAGRFARGGSTISQQLIKNVFLSRNKTIFRKLEEAIIVWLIEENRLTSKQRMFEVYLNIIEWAPGIYGVKDAAEFYFSKLPSQLTLSESIYMTSLVPKPKKFKYTFNNNGLLRKHYKGYYDLIVKNLVQQKWISSEDTLNLKPIKILSGKAWQFIDITDTLKSDSVDFNMEIDTLSLQELDIL
ncbi:MAG: transglycosylase domain-containing protein [Bacteroidales bacterium]|nr:transglycosylase domain-containing protein [Bacteroidales bacterium]